MRGLYKQYRTSIFWHTFVVNCEEKGSLKALFQTGLKVQMEVWHECSKQDGKPKGEACKHCVRHWLKQCEPNVETRWCLCPQHWVPRGLIPMKQIHIPEPLWSKTIWSLHLETGTLYLNENMRTHEGREKSTLQRRETLASGESYYCCQQQGEWVPIRTLPQAGGSWLAVFIVPVRPPVIHQSGQR